MSERRMTRRQIVALAGSASAMGLAGCTGGNNSGSGGNGSGGGSSGTTSGTGNGGGGSGKTMTVWAWNDPGLTPTRKAQGKDFKKKNGIDINWQYYPFADYLAKATSAIPAGNAPDSMALSVLWVPRFGDKGVVMDLGKNGFKASDYVTAAQNNASYDGTLYSVPWYADCRLLAINRKMFKEAGLEVPDPTHMPTWDEWKGWVEALGKKHGKAYSMAAGEGFDAFVLSNGGNYLSSDGKKAIINNDAALQAANFVQPLVTKDKYVITHPSGANTTAQDDFVSGTAPMIYAGSWNYSRFEQAKDLDWQYNPFPVGPKSKKSHTWSAGVYYSVPSRGGANTSEGLKWLNYINSDEVQARVTKQIGGFPGKKSAYDTDTFKNYVKQHPKLQVVSSQMSNTVAFPSSPEVTKMWTAVHTEAQKMWQGKDPKTALDDAAKQINSLT